MTGGYQKFYEHWNKPSSHLKFRKKKYPYELSLGAEEPPPKDYKLPPGAYSKDIPLLPFRQISMSGDKILVTKSYNRMFHRLLRLRNEYHGQGAVITSHQRPTTTLSQRLLSTNDSHLFACSTRTVFTSPWRVWRIGDMMQVSASASIYPARH